MSAKQIKLREQQEWNAIGEKIIYIFQVKYEDCVGPSTKTIRILLEYFLCIQLKESFETLFASNSFGRN